MKLVVLRSIAVPLAVLILGVGSTASAQNRIDVEAFNQELAKLDGSLTHPAPSPGLDRASGGPPRWCRGGPVKDIQWPNGVASDLEQYRARHQSLVQPFLVEAAAAVCTYNAPGYHHAATEILQYWINETGLSEADAIGSLAARIDPDAWQDEHDQLCHALGSGDSRDKEQNAMAEARVELFGCDGTSHSIGVGWMTTSSQGLFNLYPYLDRSAMERDHDEIVRLAYLSTELNLMLDPREAEHLVIARYAIDQYDIHELATAQAVRQLDAPPYRGNRFARTVVIETIGHARLAIARVEAEVAKRTHDARWKELLITVPQRAAAAWLSAADRHRDVLARSDATAALIAAHDDAAHGCGARLRADLAPIVRPLARGDARGVEDRLGSDPLLGLLIARLAACVAFEGDEWPGRQLHELAVQVGDLNGPRTAAHVATVAAAAGMKQAPFRPSDVLPELDHSHVVRHPGRSERRADDADDDETSEPTASEHRAPAHVVLAMTPAGKRGAVKLTFVRERVLVPVESCRETNKVNRVLPDGKLEYRRVCHDAGKEWRDETPSPITVPASCKAGLAAGRAVNLERDLPTEVFADKSGRRVLALGCLSLE